MASGTSIGGRLRSWALRRQGADALPQQLAARRIYILPTPAGWTFAMLVGVMFLAGMNYGNGLALLLTFWLAGFGFVVMVQTQRSLSGLELLAAAASPAHVGDDIVVKLSVAGRTAPEDLRLTADGRPRADAVPAPPAPVEGLTVRLLAQRRGRWRAPVLQLSSTAPFGLFRTWTWLTLEITTLVYPRPAGNLPVPETAGDDSGSQSRAHGYDELGWLREFREGDSPRQVAWKAYARGAPLLVRDYHGQGALRREFDFDSLDGDIEARLSQLTQWMLAANARGESWTLRLPGTAPESGAGDAHLVRCLDHVALHGLRGAA